jgi:mono/diheme cytochrome c family protein
VLRFPKKTPLAVLALALAPVLAALSACGDSAKPDLTAGKQLFTQKCGACHILNNAGTKGTQGPNLDLAFAEDIRDGIGRSTIEGVVRGQIKVPQGGVMPAKLVEGKDADAVSAYVADAIGKKAGAAAGGGPSGTAKANAKNVVDIPTDPTGQLAYKFKSASAKSGKVTVESKNDSSVPHDIALKGGPGGKLVSGGGVSSFTANLKPGSYTFYCTVPGHEQAGMKGTLSIK